MGARFPFEAQGVPADYGLWNRAVKCHLTWMIFRIIWATRQDAHVFASPHVLRRGNPVRGFCKRQRGGARQRRTCPFCKLAALGRKTSRHRFTSRSCGRDQDCSERVSAPICFFHQFSAHRRGRIFARAAVPVARPFALLCRYVGIKPREPALVRRARRRFSAGMQLF